jgi:uncharacterized protein
VFPRSLNPKHQPENEQEDVMRWKDARRSSNIEDRRGMRGGSGLKIGGGAGILIAIVFFLMGGDPSTILALLGGASEMAAPAQTGEQGTPTDEGGEFVAAVLGDTEDTWTPLFAAMGRRYEAPVLVLFTDAVQSACGTNSAAVGPFYCPGDKKVYIDLSFYRELRDRLGAPGDFAQAYVIAHEVGHHVQNLLGISDQVHNMRSGSSQAEANAMSVRLELQADCFAGIWGHSAQVQRNLIEPGDLEEGLNAAAAIGDDRLQRQAGGRVNPESWTHGSSEQRTTWLRRGLESGELARCDTFGTNTR